MNAEIKQKWLAALRSGQYEQGRCALRTDEGGQRRYCCLGVLCDLIDPTKWLIGAPGSPVAYQHDTSTGLPSPEVAELAGLSSAQLRELAHMNDAARANFRQIANWIEEHA
jgi:hypothetical protein